MTPLCPGSRSAARSASEAFVRRYESRACRNCRTEKARFHRRIRASRPYDASVLVDERGGSANFSKPCWRRLRTGAATASSPHSGDINELFGRLNKEGRDIKASQVFGGAAWQPSSNLIRRREPLGKNRQGPVEIVWEGGRRRSRAGGAAELKQVTRPRRDRKVVR